MHRPISWSALAEAASVAVWGLGVEGQASVRRLRSMGRLPVLVDDVAEGPGPEGLQVLRTGVGGLDALLRCDVVVKSPGISRYRPEVAQLEHAGVAVCGGLGLFMEETDPARVACITGTKGKSTTTALVVHLLTRLGYRAQAGGNIGHPPWDLSPDQPPEYWIVETSSFQVPDLDRGPRVVGVTSLSPDHLDWHGSVARYYADKLSLCAKPGVELVLADGSDEELIAHREMLGPHLRWVGPTDVARDATWSRRLGIPGPHNARNAAIARAVLEGLGIAEASDDASLAQAVEGFEPLPSRCRSLGTIGSVEFVDDGLSTNVLATRAALDAFSDRPLALLVGGFDRGLDYAPLAQALMKRRTPTQVVTMPDSGTRIGRALRATGSGPIQVADAGSLDEAVDVAFAWAEAAGPGTVVLLSPAAPSFGQFADYRERSAAFEVAVARCGRLT